MSSYQPLADHLAGRKGDSWEASFAEIERALGRPLPRSAYRYPAWWANQNGPGHSQTRGWRSVGWRTGKLDLEQRRVRFERDRPSNASPSVVSTGSEAPLEELIRRAKAVSGIEDRDAVIAAALREFIEQQAIEGLIAMGGTMPDLIVPPRERPDW